MRKYFLERYPLTKEDSLESLVENRTSFTYDNCELSVFETHREAHDVSLTFNHFVLTSMLAGKKVMKLHGHEDFDYFPGESLILSPGETMVIDFPEARQGNPTQCIALTIDDDVIRTTIDKLHEQFPKEQSWGTWEIDYSMLHMENSLDFADTINRMIRLTRNETGKAKDLMVGLTLQEMLIRLMQTQARHVFENSFERNKLDTPLANALNFIDGNLTTRIDLDQLADHACMSRASFFKKFKECMGETPLQYIMRKRIAYAAELLVNSQLSVTEVCFACGFRNLSHFTTTFRMQMGVTPKAFQQK